MINYFCFTIKTDTNHAEAGTPVLAVDEADALSKLFPGETLKKIETKLFKFKRRDGRVTTWPAHLISTYERGDIHILLLRKEMN